MKDEPKNAEWLASGPARRGSPGRPGPALNDNFTANANKSISRAAQARPG